MTERRFEVLLGGDLGAILRVKPSLQSGEMNIENHDGQPVLVSSLFEAAPDRDAVMALAESMVPAIRAAMILAATGLGAVTVSGVREFETGGNAAVTTHVQSFQAMAYIAPAGGTPAPPPPRIRAELALTDRPIAEAFLHLQRDDGWVGLYKVFEIVRDDAGGLNGLVKAGLTTKPEASRFTHSANHPTTGPGARHSRLPSEAPVDPMTLAEARDVIRGLLERWLATK